MSKRFGKNPEIILYDGQIDRLFMGDSCVLRGFTFESEVEQTMRYLAGSEPSEFMELYLSLTNDETFSKIASKIYDELIDKKLYPYETMKSLRISDFPSNSDSALRFSCGNFRELLITNDLVINITNALTTKESCYRNETGFFKRLTNTIYSVANSNTKQFMELYEVVKNDPLAFKIADDVRKKLLESAQQELANETKKIQNEIHLLSCI